MSSRRQRHDSRTPARAALAGAGTLALAALAGCYSPGGTGFSGDKFTYHSTPWQPWTVTLVDTRTNQQLWTADVPVGQQLTIKFRKDRGTEGQNTPDLMQWELMPLGTRFGQLDNALPVPPANARRLDTTLRPTPELPADMSAAAAPQPPVIVLPESDAGVPVTAPDEPPMR